MENATKALLIAAAVLVAILIISLGLVVYNMASETIGAVNFSGQEITAFNDKFTQYQGANVRGSEVNAMLKTVLNSNMQSRTEGLAPKGAAGKENPKFVQVKLDGNIILAITDASISNDTGISTAKTYPVKVVMDKDTGFVCSIEVGTASADGGEDGGED